MKTLTSILLTASLASGAALASTPTTNDAIPRTKSDRILEMYQPYLEEPVKSFTALQTDSWQPISRTQLVLWTTFNDAYLLTVTGNCSELPFARTVGVTSTTSQISTFDSVLVHGDRCPITQIQPIDIKRMKADRDAVRRANS